MLPDIWPEWIISAELLLVISKSFPSSCCLLQSIMFSVGDIKKHRGHWTPHGKLSGHVGLHQRREWWFDPGGFAQMKWSLEEGESKLWAVSERSLTLRKVASPSFILALRDHTSAYFRSCQRVQLWVYLLTIYLVTDDLVQSLITNPLRKRYPQIWLFFFSSPPWT